MLFPEALQYLLSLGHETLAIKLGLEKIEKLLDALGHPTRGLPKVQIAGTNGKGSTAAMLEAIVRASGADTGLYTSPHLVSITERIRINGEDISPENFALHATRVRRAAESLVEAGEIEAPPSFFEQVTAIALVAFASARTVIAILETGLGGRLDATTAARAETVAITSIAMDHQEYLGDTLAEIGAEKAAIIRPGVKAVIGAQKPEAVEVILRRCEECGVTPRFATNNYEVKGADETGRLRVSFKTGRERYEDVLLALRGRHQIENAATAIALAESLTESGFRISPENIVRGLETARHAGRMELKTIGRHSVLFDGAHNAAGALALRSYLDEFARDRFITLIFGAMRDKDLTEIGRTLFPAARRLILTEPTNPRSAAPEQLLGAAPDGFDSGGITIAKRFNEAFAQAQEITPADGLICVTGSLYLVGEAQALLLK